MLNIKRFTVMIVIIFTVTLTVYAGARAEADNQPSGVLNLKSALADFTGYIDGRIPGSAITAIAITDVPVKKLGDYISDELSSLLLNNAGLRMVSRQDFENILNEQSLQAAVDFNDESTARMGRNLGWQTVVFGSVNPMSDSYRLSLRAVEVETGELLGAKSFFLDGKDPVLISLINPDISVQQLAERETILQPFSGKSNNFRLSVSTNKSVYYDNEIMFITLEANEDCYFVVYHVDVYNNMQVIFPNRWERSNNFLKANVARVIPENSTYLLIPPYGEERILVYASETQFRIPSDQYRPRSISSDFLADPEALWHIENDDAEDEFVPVDLIASDDSHEIDCIELAEEIPADTSIEIAVLPMPPQDNNRGLAVTPRGATAQVIYTILPR